MKVSSGASTERAEWTQRRERGSRPLLWLMGWLSLRFGRAILRVPLRLIVAYFLLFGGAARRASRDFLRHVHGRAPKIAEQFQLLLSFASTLHDRVYFLKNRFELFEIEVNGVDVFDERGMLLLGSHLGSFEALRATGRHLGHRRVVMAMFEENAQQTNGVLAAIDSAALSDVVTLGRPASMLELAERLDEGALVGLLADRTLGNEPVVHVDFLGESAPFPTGPMRMAAALGQRVSFMVGLYRGTNRYEIHFEALEDFSDLGGPASTERTRRVEEAVVRYAKRLEHYARSAPSNWFNFYDFWQRAR
jgi:predicted LPLAT superfamily acyltransferase